MKLLSFSILILVSYLSKAQTATSLTDYFNETAKKEFLFYENKGQLRNTDGNPIPEVKYYSDKTYPNLFLSKEKMSMVFAKESAGGPDSLHRIDMVLQNSNGNNSNMYVEEEKNERVNYFFEHAPDGISNLKGYNRVIVSEIYPNIDMHYYSNQTGLKYYFIVKPGGNPNNILMKFEGTTGVSINNASGELKLKTLMGEFIQEQAHVYELDQNNNIGNVSFQAKYMSAGLNKIRFQIGNYSPNKRLVIQVDRGHIPNGSAASSNAWSTYLGGSKEDIAYDVTTHSDGFVYVTGYTKSQNFPATFGPIPSNSDQNAFIAKFDIHGVRNWVTLYGGNNYEFGYGIAINENKELYVTGSTSSSNFPFPTNNNGIYIQDYGGGSRDGFLLQIDDTTGIALWATCFGGSSDERAYKTVVDNNGNIFIVGRTSYQDLIGYSNGGAITTGYFPVKYLTNSYTQDAFGGTNNLQNENGFIAKFNNFHGLEWSSLWGGESYDEISDIAINKLNGDIYIVGKTNTDEGYDACSNNQNWCGCFPVCNPGGAYYQYIIGSNPVNKYDAFLARFNNNGDLKWSTYFGGNGDDLASSVIVNSQGKVYISGITNSGGTNSCYPGNPFNNNFTLCQTSGTYTQPFGNTTNSGLNHYDAFIAMFDTLNTLKYSSFFGGKTDEGITAGLNIAQNFLAVDVDDNIYLAGITALYDTTNNFPTKFKNNYYFKKKFSETIQNVPEAFLAQFNSSNQLTYCSLYGGTRKNSATNFGVDFPTGIATINDKSLFIVGYTNSSDFPYECSPFVQGIYCQDSTYFSTGDAFISRFDLKGPIGFEENEFQSGQFKIYPNPASNIITVEFEIENLEKFQISIYNSIGQFVQSQQFEGIGMVSKNIDLTECPNGMYFIKMDLKGQSITKKVIKQN